MPATVLLVHGAWHGAWCWDRVGDHLARRGVTAFAVDLSGHGGDPRPLGDLHTDSARVRDALDEIDGPVDLLAGLAAASPV